MIRASRVASVAGVAAITVLLIGASPFGGGGTSAQIADGSITLAKLANLSTDKVIGRVTAGTGVPEAVTFTDQAQALADDTTAAAMRTTLGFDDESVTDQFVVLGSDFTTSSTTPASVTGWSYTPDASSVYYVQVLGNYTSAATTTGLTWAPVGGDASGSMYASTRGASANASAVVWGTSGGGGYATGTTATAAATGFSGWLLVTTDASPTAFTVEAASEVGGSDVTIKAGSVMIVRKVQ